MAVPSGLLPALIIVRSRNSRHGKRNKKRSGRIESNTSPQYGSTGIEAKGDDNHEVCIQGEKRKAVAESVHLWQATGRRENTWGVMLTCPSPMKCPANLRTRWHKGVDSAVVEWNCLISEYRYNTAGGKHGNRTDHKQPS